jgi:hypothetical protein
MEKVKVILENKIPKKRRCEFNYDYEDIEAEFYIKKDKNFKFGAFKFNGKYYSMHSYNPAKEYCIVQEIKFKDYDTDSIADIKCPYCGHNNIDPWDMPDSSEEICDICGNAFYYEREVEVYYSSSKVKEYEILEVEGNIR